MTATPSEFYLQSATSSFRSISVNLHMRETPVVYTTIPNCGDARGGTPVSVLGLNILDTSKLSCRFGHLFVDGE